MFSNNFGIEIEFTGITRLKAARAAAAALSGTVERRGSSSEYKVISPDGREWSFVSDGSIKPLKM